MLSSIRVLIAALLGIAGVTALASESCTLGNSRIDEKQSRAFLLSEGGAWKQIGSDPSSGVRYIQFFCSSKYLNLCMMCIDLHNGKLTTRCFDVELTFVNKPQSPRLAQPQSRNGLPGTDRLQIHRLNQTVEISTTTRACVHLRGFWKRERSPQIYRIALRHQVDYKYDQPVILEHHRVHLVPQKRSLASVVDQRISISCEGSSYYVEIQGNDGERGGHIDCIGTTRHLTVRNDMVFDIAPELRAPKPELQAQANRFPVEYSKEESELLKSYLGAQGFAGPRLQKYLSTQQPRASKIWDWLKATNESLPKQLPTFARYTIGIQEPEVTLQHGGSCRDFSWLLIQICRNKGIAARFVSGYQVLPQIWNQHASKKHLGDLHAWVEVYLPGAGWYGWDPTTGKQIDSTYIPLSAHASAFDALPLPGSFRNALQLGDWVRNKLHYEVRMQLLTRFP